MHSVFTPPGCTPKTGVRSCLALWQDQQAAFDMLAAPRMEEVLDGGATPAQAGAPSPHLTAVFLHEIRRAGPAPVCYPPALDRVGRLAGSHRATPHGSALPSGPLAGLLTRDVRAQLATDCRLLLPLPKRRPSLNSLRRGELNHSCRRSAPPATAPHAIASLRTSCCKRVCLPGADLFPADSLGLHLQRAGSPRSARSG